jgi:hypothetical protein
MPKKIKLEHDAFIELPEDGDFGYDSQSAELNLEAEDGNVIAMVTREQLQKIREHLTSLE